MTEISDKNIGVPSLRSPNGPWALVLGGSAGLGLASAKKLAAHGFNIIVVHRDRRSDLEHIKNNFTEITSTGVVLKTFNMDATNPEKRAKMIIELRAILGESKINVLLHSIAKGNLKPMHSEDGSSLRNSDFKLTLDAMALSLYDWVKEVHAARLFASDTRIIAFTSEGNHKVWPNYAAISAAKAALEAIIRNIALEFAPMGIKANCIQAGITDTAALQLIPGHEDLKENALKRNPNKRLTTPEDVANVVYLLSTDEAKWITGTVIKVDGGESLQ